LDANPVIQFSVEKVSPFCGYCLLKKAAYSALLHICVGSSLLRVLLLLCSFNEKGATSSTLSVDCNKEFILSGKMVQECNILRGPLSEME